MRRTILGGSGSCMVSVMFLSIFSIYHLPFHSVCCCSGSVPHAAAPPIQPVKGTGSISAAGALEISTLEPLDRLYFCRAITPPTTGNRINLPPAVVRSILRQNRLCWIVAGGTFLFRWLCPRAPGLVQRTGEGRHRSGWCRRCSRFCTGAGCWSRRSASIAALVCSGWSRSISM